jgi:hypothetical protein
MVRTGAKRTGGLKISGKVGRDGVFGAPGTVDYEGADAVCGKLVGRVPAHPPAQDNGAVRKGADHARMAVGTVVMVVAGTVASALCVRGEGIGPILSSDDLSVLNVKYGKSRTPSEMGGDGSAVRYCYSNSHE